ncbi:MAG: hypothetical protein ACLGIG_11295 [Actinomycetes bacterium]
MAAAAPREMLVEPPYDDEPDPLAPPQEAADGRPPHGDGGRDGGSDRGG